MAILYVAAERAELKGFETRLSGARALKWPIDYAMEGILDGRRVLLAANGAGPKRASQAVEIAIRAVTAADLSSSRLEAVVSVGFCGALVPSLREETVVVGEEVIDATSGASFRASPVECDDPAVLTVKVLSQNRVAVTVSEKQQLAASGAAVVEMEASGVATRASRANLHFACVKVVTDRAEESFGIDLNAMRTPNGRIARGKIVVYALTHPWLIPELLRWKRRADRAAQALGAFLVRCRINVSGNSGESEGAQSGFDGGAVVSG